MQQQSHKKMHDTINGTVGLVVCGGKSVRMGTDKSQLNYHGRSQRTHLFELISPFCEKVFLSLNQHQAQTYNDIYPIIADTEETTAIGPMAALINAYRLFPGKDLLLIGCDYPYLNEHVLKTFMESVEMTGRTTAFYNSSAGLYEPLLAFYHAGDCSHILKQFEQMNYSLQFFLKSILADRFYPSEPDSIISVDTREAYWQAKGSIVI